MYHFQLMQVQSSSNSNTHSTPLCSNRKPNFWKMKMLFFINFTRNEIYCHQVCTPSNILFYQADDSQIKANSMFTFLANCMVEDQLFPSHKTMGNLLYFDIIVLFRTFLQDCPIVGKKGVKPNNFQRFAVKRNFPPNLLCFTPFSLFLSFSHYVYE